MKKRLLVGLLFFILCFTLVGCGKEGTKKDGGETSGVATGADNNDILELYSDENRIVFNYSDIYYIVYYYEGEQITGLEFVYMYEDEASAKIGKTMFDSSYEDDDSVESIVVNGRRITITFKESAYEDETVAGVKTTYSFLEQVYNND